MHKYKTWCTNTKLDAQIQNVMHKYKHWCTNTKLDAHIQNVMHTYKTWCTHTKLDAQMPILIHKCQYWCTDTNIDAQMPISMHKCQYRCTNANIDAQMPIVMHEYSMLTHTLYHKYDQCPFPEIEYAILIVLIYGRETLMCGDVSDYLKYPFCFISKIYAIHETISRMHLTFRSVVVTCYTKFSKYHIYVKERNYMWELIPDNNTNMSTIQTQ